MNAAIDKENIKVINGKQVWSEARPALNLNALIVDGLTVGLFSVSERGLYHAHSRTSEKDFVAFARSVAPHLLVDTSSTDLEEIAKRDRVRFVFRGMERCGRKPGQHMRIKFSILDRDSGDVLFETVTDGARPVVRIKVESAEQAYQSSDMHFYSDDQMRAWLRSQIERFGRLRYHMSILPNTRQEVDLTGLLG